MTDQVTLCNLALDAMGSRSSISSLQEPSAEARALSRHYAAALDTMLTAAHWNFARTQVTLTLLNDASLSPPQPVPAPWLYEYQYPADCVQLRYLMPTWSNFPASVPGASNFPWLIGPPVRFIVSNDRDSGGNDIAVILSNQSQAVGVYTKRITNPSLFSADFVQAFAHYLGWKISIPLSGDKALAKMCFDTADRLSREAQKSNGNEGLTVLDQTPDWMRVRGFENDYASPPGSMYFTAPQNLVMIT